MFLKSIIHILNSNFFTMTQILTKSGYLRQTSRLVLLLSAFLWWTTGVRAQVTGAKYIPTDYPTLLAAIQALNAQGVGAGGATINIPAGYTETAPTGQSWASGIPTGYELGSSVLNSTLNAANPLVFKKDPATSGANPLLTAFAGTQLASATGTYVDGIWRFIGTDYVTIDGIDLLDPTSNTTTAQMMEYGYGFYKENATNGASNNTVKNCTITLNRANNVTGAGPRYNGSTGIDLAPSHPFTANVEIVATSVDGGSSNNKFYSNTIQNVNTCISLSGSAVAAPYTFADLNNDIGGTGSGTGNTLIDFGGAAAATNPSAAVWIRAQWTFNVSYNTINNNTTGNAANNHVSTLRGILTSNTSPNANGTINNNTITLQFGGTNSQVSCIENSAGNTGSTNTITINNNTIQNCTNVTATTSTWYGIWNNASSPTNLNIQNNTFTGNQTNATGATYVVYSNGTPTGIVNLTNNQISHSFVGTSVNTGAFYGVGNTNAATTATVNISDNNIFNITHTTAATGIMYFLYAAGSPNVLTLNNNTWTGLSLNHSGTEYIVYNGASTQTTLNFTNNKIMGSFTRTAATGTTYVYYGLGSSPGTCTQTYSGNIFSNMTSSTAGTGVLYCMYNLDYLTVPYPKKTFFNNTYSNINYNTTGTFYGMYVVGMGEIGGTQSSIYNNTIDNITTSGSMYGLYPSGTYSGTTQAPRCYGNTVSNLTTNGAASFIYASYIGSSINTAAWGGLHFYNNKIYNISANGATGVARGIMTLSAQPYNIHNNYVGSINAPNSSLTAPAPAITGIYLNSGSTVNLAYNTVNLSATAGGVNFGSAALYAATAINLNTQNNVLVNTSVANGTGFAIAYQRNSTTANTHLSTSNNNILYAGVPAANKLIYFDGTNNDQTIVGYKVRMAPADALTGTENPTFLSLSGAAANFLHLSPSVATLAESGGTSAATTVTSTTDFDGDTRNATTPDIGADEFAGIPAPALAAPINFTSNTPLTNSFNITWDDNSVGEAGFIISRSTSASGPFVTVGVVSSTTSGAVTPAAGTTYTLAQTGLLGNTTYYYQIVATNATSSPALTGSASTAACGAGLAGTIPVGPTGTYVSLTAALADLQTNGMSGATILELQAAYVSNVETYPLVFGTNIGCLNATNTLTIRPETGVATPLSITSGVATQTIKLDGANYVTFDGRPGGSGTSKMLNISNTNATGVAVLFVNDASNNAITYCDIQGQNTTFSATALTQAGVIFFGVANATNLMGNDNNSITYCNVHGVGNGTTNVPANCIAGFGTSTNVASYNDLGNVSNNNIYDFYNLSGSNGIKLDAGHTAWTINNNSFYLTAASPVTFGGTGTHRAIWITPSTTSISNAANNFTITNNFIGGNSANATGTLSITATTAYMFWGMDISLGMGTASTVSNNTIKNITMVTTSTASNAFTGINLNQGNINCTNNLIGSTTTNGNITVTTGAGGGFHGIRTSNAIAGTYTISNNTISGIDITAPLVTNHNISYCITASGGLSNTISNNIIGGTLNNSINFINASTSVTASVLKAIIANGGSSNTITNNTISNLNMNYSSTGAQATTLCGIELSSGAGVVTGNTITKLYSNTQTTNSGTTPPIIGILYNSATLTANVSNNTIHTLGLLNSAATAGCNITGIYFSGSANANVIEKNMIHSLYTTSATATGGNITGMDLAAGTVTVKNNMIRLGYDNSGGSVIAPMTVRGVTKNSSIVNFWFNSIFVGGTGVGTATANSLAFNRNAAGATADDIRNNIFMNSRSNATTGGKHYAMYLPANNLLTLDYNDYFADGTGNVLGFNGADVATFYAGWSGVSSHDLHSYSEDPHYINPTGSATTGDLHINATIPTIVEQTGTAFFTVSDDIDGQTRNTLTPADMGADAGNFVSRLCTGTPTAGTAVSANANICTGNNTSVSLSGYSNQPGISLQWMQSATAGGPYTAAAGQNTTASYSSPVLTSNIYYVCEVTCNPGGTTLGSPVTSTEVGITVNDPIVTPAAPAPSRCGPGTVPLVASTSAGATMYWFDPSNALIGSGPSITSPNLTATTNFTVKSVVPAGPGLVTVGTGTTVNTTSSYPTPFGQFYTSSHEQYLIRASELSALNLVAGNITSLAFNLGTGYTYAALANFKVLIGATAATAMTATPISTGLTSVYGGATGVSYTPPNAAGWATLNFSTPFFWDGSSNIVVDVSFMNCATCPATTCSSWTNNGIVVQSATSFVSAYTTHADGNCTVNTMTPTSGVTTYSQRPNMRLNGVIGCVSPTVTVTATIASPPIFTVSNAQRVCNNAIAMLPVTSSTAAYDSVTWSPITNLYLDNAATVPYTANANADTVYYKSATAGAATVTANGFNKTSPYCAATATTTVTTQPATSTISAFPGGICVSGSTAITLTGTNVGIQWQDSTLGGVWTNIAGAVGTTYTTPTLSGTPPSTDFFYRARVMPSTGADCYATPITITATIPTVIDPRDTTRCGVGSATLVASGSAGTTLKWYAALSGGASLGTGSPFNTPSIAATTTYYVSATSGSSLVNTTVGTGVVVNTTTTYPSPFGQWFGADHEQYLITAAELYALGLSSGNISSVAFNQSAGYTGAALQNYQVRMANTSATAMTTSLITTGITTVYGGMGTTFTPPATAGWATINLTTPFFWDGASNLVVDVSFVNCSVCNGTSSCTTSYTYNGTVNQTTTPFVSTVYIISDNNCTINTMTPSNTGTTMSQRPNMRFDIEQGCASAPREAVVATVTAPPALTITPNQIACNNEIVALSVTSTVGDFDSYVWSPATDLYTDAAATTPYVAGANVPTGTVYMKSATAGVKPLVCTASNGMAPFCANVAKDTVTVQPASMTVSGYPATICISGTSVLTLASATSNMGIQWQDSLVGGVWTNIAAATNATYTTPTLTADAYYRGLVKNSLGATCLAQALTMVVNNPLITDTTNVTRCGAGTVTLDATANAGSSINWYTAATGGAPIATGTTFTTPVISANTTYYVSASVGGTTMNGGKPSTNGADGTNTIGGIYFTANQSFNLNSVVMYPTGAGTATIVLYAGSTTVGTAIYTYTHTFTAAAPTGVTVPLNWAITPGTYTLYRSGGTAGCWRDFAGGAALPTTAYPYPIGSACTLTDGTLAGYCYFFYNWSISTGCEQPTRTPVTAAVSPAPVLTISPTTAAVCAGTPIAVTVSSPTPTTQYDTYVWSAGANATGSAAAGYTLAPTSAGTYTLTATQTSGLLCGAIATVTATVNPVPVVSTVTATPTPVCEGAVVNLASAGSGVSSTSYDMTSIPYAPQTGGTTPLAGPTGDDASTSTPLGFDFNFWGVNYTNPTITMYTNGFIQIGTSSASTAVYGQTLPNAAAPNNIVAGLFEDLNVTGGGTVTSFTTGTAPNRVFNVKYTDVKYYVANGNISFQIQLFERTNVIEVHVFENNDAGTGQTPTLGIENAAGTSAVTAYNSTYSAVAAGGAHEAWRFTPTVTSYAWAGPGGYTSGSQNPVIPNMALAGAGVYTVTFTNAANCTASGTVPVTVTPGPASVVSGSAAVCDGATGPLVSIALTGTAPWTITYTNGTPTTVTTSTNPYTFNAVSTSPSTYTVSTLVDATTCAAIPANKTGSAAITINPLPTGVTASASTTTLCLPGTVDLYSAGTAGSGAMNTTYDWVSNPAGYTSSTQTPTSVAPTGNTTYTVTVTDVITTCSASANVTVNVGNTPGTSTLNVSTPIHPGCNNQIDLSAGGAASGYYAWHTDAVHTAMNYAGSGSTLTATPGAPNTYTYYVFETDATGLCYGSSAPATFTTVGPVPTNLPTTPGTVTANGVCLDAQGWSHFYNDAAVGGPVLLLSIDETTHYMGTMGVTGDYTVSMEVYPGYGSGTALHICSGSGPGCTGTSYPSSNDWYVMNRDWSVNIINAGVAQVPAGQTLPIRSYFTNTDFQDVQGTLLDSVGGSPIAVSNMYFYKISGNPSNTQSGVTPSQVVVYSNAATPTVNNAYLFALANSGTPPAYSNSNGWGWQLNSFTANTSGVSQFYAKMKVPSFSSGGGGGSPVTPMPVDGLILKGTHSEGVNTLTWSTQQEQSNSRFEVLRGQKKDIMNQIGSVATKAPNGTSNSPLDYEYVDANPSAKTLFYVLRQVDIDGHTSMSNMVEITSDDEYFVSLDAYPNPTSKTLNVSFNVPTNSRLAVEIHDVLGKVVYQQTYTAVGGDEVLSLDVSKLATGSYTLQIRSKTTDFSAISRFVKINE